MLQVAVRAQFAPVNRRRLISGNPLTEAEELHCPAEQRTKKNLHAFKIQTCDKDKTAQEERSG